VKEKDVNYSKWSPLESDKEKVKNFLKEIELNNS
jgi:hypothetical protein